MALKSSLKSKQGDDLEASSAQEDKPHPHFEASSANEETPLLFQKAKTWTKMVSHSVDVKDSMTYHTQDLASWSAMLHFSSTVWSRKSLWTVALRLLVLSFLVAVLVMCLCHDPANLKVSRFKEISSFLRVFVGLLLGFFMSASVKRWWDCATSFQDLLDTTRRLQIWLNSCGGPEEKTIQCLRYGVLSAWILSFELHVEASRAEHFHEAVQAAWDKFATGQGRDKVLGHLTQEELQVLRSVADPPGALWMWIGSLLGNYAEEGYIPLVTSPTFGRFMHIADSGFMAVRGVRSSITFQAPFIYVQMLASLVHINNIINAISFGLTWGASVGTLLVYYGIGYHFAASNAKATEEEASTDMQSLVVSFFFSCFGPFVYQALLETSIAIAQPFSNEDAVLPTERMVSALEKNLNDGMLAAQKITWKQPCFKK